MHAEPTPLPNFSFTYYWPSVYPFFSAADLADPKNIDLLVSAELINTLLDEAGYPDIPVKYVFISYDFPGRRRVKTILSGKAAGSIFLGVTVVDMYTFTVRVATAISKAVGIPPETAAMLLYMNTSPLVYALAAFVRKTSEPHTPLTAEVFEGEIEEPDAERITESFIASAEYAASLAAFSPSYVDADYVRKEATEALLDSLWALEASSNLPEEIVTASERIADAVKTRYT